MISCFFKKLTQLLMIKYRGKMILKVKAFTRDVCNSYDVLTCFIGSKKLFIRKKLSDNDDRILIDLFPDSCILNLILPWPSHSVFKV